MATTTLYKITKPTVGGDADSWGGILNTGLDAIDKLANAFATTGSANAYVLTTGQSLSAYATGMRFRIIPNFTNSGAATLNVDTLGAKNIYKNSGGTVGAVASGDIVSGVPITVTYDGTQFVAHLNAAYQPLDATLTSIAATTGPISRPQGRLTLTSATSVTTNDVTAATTLYYALHEGNIVPIYDGTQFLETTFTELSLALSNNSGHTNYHQSGKNFDVWAFSDSGTLRLGTGAAWTNDTTRADALTRVSGVYVNNATIAAMRFGSASGNTVSVAANAATLVGTIRCSADGQTEDSLAKRFVWNMYNRVSRAMEVNDTTDSWAYSTNTFRQINNSTANQLAFVRGLNEDAVIARAHGIFGTSGATWREAAVALGLDSTTTPTGRRGSGYASTSGAASCDVFADYDGFPGLGYHYIAGLERGAGADTQTWVGDGGGLNRQSGISGLVMA